MSSITETVSDVEHAIEDLFGDMFEVVVLDDPVTLFDTVVDALVLVCGHPRQVAERLTMKVHETGSAAVYIATLASAETVALDLRQRGLKATVRPVSR